MNIEDIIYVRKSCRKYSDEEIIDDEFRQIGQFISSAKALNDNIDFDYEILTKNQVNIRTPWSAPYYFAFYSQKRDNYMENIGFIFQQVSLYLHTMGIGSCWVGMARPKVKKDNFIITMSFGKSDDITREITKFKRKDKSKFADYDDEKLKPAYYAPSAVNSQPWYFTHSDEGFDLYQVRQNVVKRKILGGWNPIDVGICLAHLYVSNRDTFDFKVLDNPVELKGYDYVGTVSI